MIFHPVIQRTENWYRLRLGIPTASEFHRIITPKTRKISTQAPGYMYRLLAEWVTGEPLENVETQWMTRGTELEDQAIAAYEGLLEVETLPGGFFTDDAGMIGCSPDRLIGEDGDLEIKAPLIQTQIEYALTGAVDGDYMTQLQGRMLIHGRKYVDIFSYHPAIMIPPKRVLRDEEFIKQIGVALKTFVDQLLTARATLEREFGPFVRPKPEADYSRDFLTEEDAEMILAAIADKENNVTKSDHD